MKVKKYFLLFIILFPLMACKKDVELLPKSTIITVDSDSIIYSDISDTGITSARSYTNSPLGCGLVPNPMDSTANFLIDVDQDLIVDFKIQVQHFHDLNCTSPGNPCSTLPKYWAGIYSLQTNYFVSNKFKDVYSPYMFVSGDTINGARNWGNSVFIWVNACPAPYFAFAGNKYIGLKIQKGGKTYYGWMMLSKDPNNWKFYLKSYAINYSNNKPILAGQTH